MDGGAAAVLKEFHGAYELTKHCGCTCVLADKTSGDVRKWEALLMGPPDSP